MVINKEFSLFLKILRLKCSKVNFLSYIYYVTNQIKIMTLKQIANISGEFLTYSEFKEYVTDYFKNPREYRIDKRSRYYKEIQYCYSNTLSSYYEYCDLFE